jgi:hypothetical protein
MSEAEKANGARREITDQRVRDRIRNDLDTTLVVEAAAGTGKTTALVNRIVAALARGRAELGRIVAVTFTEKAAGEMKLRLRTEIERARAAATPEERGRLVLALEELEEAHIGTIHGFCADLLRQRPVEACVDPLFEAADEDQQSRLFDEAFGSWFQRVLGDPPEGVRRILRHKPRGWDRTGPRELLRKAGLGLVQQRDFTAPWRRDAFDRKAAIDSVVSKVIELGALASQALDKEDWAAKSLAEIARVASEIQRREEIRGRDYDGLEEELRELARPKFWGWKGRGKWFAEGVTREDVLARRQAAVPPRGPPAARASLRRAEGARGQARLPRSPAAHEGSRPRQRRRPSRAPGALHAPARRRVSRHRPAPGGDPAAPRGRRSRRERLPDREAGPGQALRRR